MNETGRTTRGKPNKNIGGGVDAERNFTSMSK